MGANNFAAGAPPKTLTPPPLSRPSQSRERGKPWASPAVLPLLPGGRGGQERGPGWHRPETWRGYRSMQRLWSLFSLYFLYGGIDAFDKLARIHHLLHQWPSPSSSPRLTHSITVV